MKDDLIFSGFVFHACALAFAIFVGLKSVDLKVEVNVCEQAVKEGK